MLWTMLNNLRGAMRAEEAIAHFLSTAAHQTDRQMQFDPGLRQLPDSYRPDLMAAATWLRTLPSRDRLKAMDEMMLGLDRLRDAPWLPAGAATQLCGMARGTGAVRLCYSASLHPALLLALDGKEQGSVRHIQFVDMSEATCFMAEAIAALLEVDLEVRCAYPLDRPEDERFETEISLPPFGWRPRQVDLSPSVLRKIGVSAEPGRLGIEALTIADLLGRDGRAIIATSSSFLFRSVGIEAASRQALLASRRLAAVISLPAGVFYTHTMIGMNLLVLDQGDSTRAKVRMLDLSREPYVVPVGRGRNEISRQPLWADLISHSADDAVTRDVPLDTIKANGLILTIDRYFNAGIAETIESFFESIGGSVELTACATLIRPQMIRPEEDGEVLVREVSPGDFNDRGYLNPPRKEFRTDRAMVRRNQDQCIQAGDILLSIKGRIGDVALVTEEAQADDAVRTAGQSLIIIRPNKGVSSVCLYEFFSKRAVTEHLQSRAGGAGVQMINMQDIRSLRVPLLAAAEMQAVEDAFHRRQDIHDQIEELQKQSHAMRDAVWPVLNGSWSRRRTGLMP